MTDSRNFLLSTDYPLDKAIYITSGSIVVGASSTASSSFPHNLGFTPLLVGSWSTSLDFATTHEFLSGPSSSTNYLYLTLDALANSTSVFLEATNLSGSSETLYYRLFAFEPYGSTELASHTQSQGSNLLLDRDVNYMKLVDSGYVLFNYSASTQTHSINHSSGYGSSLVWYSVDPVGSSAKFSRLFRTDEFAFGVRSGIYAEMYDGRMDIVAENLVSEPFQVYWRLYADG